MLPLPSGLASVCEPSVDPGRQLGDRESFGGLVDGEEYTIVRQNDILAIVE